MAGTIAVTLSYQGSDRQVSWCGVRIADGKQFEFFLSGEVASRLRDEEGTAMFAEDLRGLAGTGFASKTVNKILAAEILEERDWAIG